MRRNKRLSKEKYQELQKFKREVNKERADKFVKDHSGHVYKINEHGMLTRVSVQEILQNENSNISNPGPAIGSTIKH